LKGIYVGQDGNNDNADVGVNNLNLRIVGTWFKPEISHVIMLKKYEKDKNKMIYQTIAI
jgi:hypothetical protein